MPELPEVETICRSLRSHILNKEIDDVVVLWPDAVETFPDTEFSKILQGCTFENISRRGKYLLLSLSKGVTLVIHLRMTGQLIYHGVERGSIDIVKHTHVIFYLSEGELHFVDTRKFGRIQLIDTLDVQEFMDKLGPEPLDENFEFDILGIQLARLHKNASIKAALLDQEVVAGLGNIYVDEVLFAAGVRPDRPVNELKASEIVLIHQAIRDILTESIAFQGTTFRDYRDAEGKAGKFQKSLKVYGRGGKPCVNCQNKLESQKISGRSTCFCSHCQS